MITVVSLFDGMSCGYEALKRAGIPVKLYIAAEIDKHAIKIAKKNHPDIVHLGCVKELRKMVEAGAIGHVDLLLGGSPCQGFSFAGNQLAFDDPRSQLFFEYVKIMEALKKRNPNLKVLLENVRMKKPYLDIISQYMGCGEPHMINSALVSAQNRKRYYWYNWDAPEPEDKGIMLKDIVHENCDIKPAPINERNIKEFKKSLSGKSGCLLASSSYKGAGNNGMPLVFQDLEQYIVPFDKTLQILDKEVERGKVGYFRKDSQANRVYYIHGKSVTLTGCSGGGAAKMGQYLFGCITPNRVEKRQRGQRFNEGEKFYTLTSQDVHGILVEGYIRKLTPVECERLQTLPDNYTEGVSDTQRYKMLGNGWTVDVITHLLRYMYAQSA